MTSEQLDQLAQRLLDHARLHESLVHQDEEQTQWAEDLKQAAMIVRSVANETPHD